MEDVSYFHTLNRDVLGEVLLQLDPETLDNLCSEDEYIQSVCDNEGFKESYEMKWKKSIREKFEEKPAAISKVGNLGDEVLFFELFGQLESPNEKLDALFETINVASRRGSPRFALRLLDYLTNYAHTLIGTRFEEQANQDLLVAKRTIVKNLARRGDVDASVNFADKWGIDREYVILGYILGRHPNYQDRERELSTSIHSPQVSTRIIRFLIENNHDLLFTFMNEYPSVAQYALYAMLRSQDYRKNLPLVMEILRRYPVRIRLLELYAAIDHSDIDLFEDLLSIMPPLNGRKIGLLLYTAIRATQSPSATQENYQFLIIFSRNIRIDGLMLSKYSQMIQCWTIFFRYC